MAPVAPAQADSFPPDFASVKSSFTSSYATLLDRHDQPLHSRRIDLQNHRMDWVALDDVSPALVDAVIHAEDRDFYTHQGIDWGATARAGWQLLWGGRSRGASTISMQVAGLLEKDLRWQSGGRSLGQKWRQMNAARALEGQWSKAQILEAYFNLTSWRGDLQGLGVASAGLFQKQPHALTRDEALLLAALLPSPNASPPRVALRACTLASWATTSTECQRLRDLAALNLDRRKPPQADSPALEALSARLLSTAGEHYRSTLDAGLQRQAQDVLRTQLVDLARQEVTAGAVLVLDNASGEVLAYVANAGLVDSARYVDGVQALRQAGSTLKPFLFEQAIEKKYLTAASILDDAPLSLSTPTGLYAPQNYDSDFKGPVSARMALAGSLNIPTVRVLTVVGVEPFWQRLKDLGFNSLTEAPEFYGYALALGSADVSLWMLANAYRTLANGGLYSEAVFQPGERQAARAVLDPAASFIVSDILSDRNARAITFGWESPLSTPFWTAVKTGTSKDMRDNWCIGFSPRYTVAVWVGNLNGAPMRDVSGITGAAPVWAALMRQLEGGRLRISMDQPPVPPGLVQQPVVFSGLKEAARREWFMAGTQMAQVDYLPSSGARIIYPAVETLIALDPDIPAARQTLRLRAELGGEPLHWWLNGHYLAPAADYDWAARPGRHRLELRNAQGLVKDSVWFTVRGRLKAQP